MTQLRAVEVARWVRVSSAPRERMERERKEQEREREGRKRKGSFAKCEHKSQGHPRAPHEHGVPCTCVLTFPIIYIRLKHDT